MHSMTLCTLSTSMAVVFSVYVCTFSKLVYVIVKADWRFMFASHNTQRVPKRICVHRAIVALWNLLVSNFVCYKSMSTSSLSLFLLLRHYLSSFHNMLS